MISFFIGLFTGACVGMVALACVLTAEDDDSHKNDDEK